MRSPECRDESPKGRTNRSSQVSRSLVVTLSMLVATGNESIRNILTEESLCDMQTARSFQENPEDLAHLQQIDADLDAALDHCTSCENLIGIAQVLATLFPRSTPVSIEELREVSKNRITETLYIPVERSLTILECNPHLASIVLDLTEKKLAELPMTDLGKAPLSLVLSHCRKQMREQWSAHRELAQKF